MNHNNYMKRLDHCLRLWRMARTTGIFPGLDRIYPEEKIRRIREKIRLAHPLPPWPALNVHLPGPARPSVPCNARPRSDAPPAVCESAPVRPSPSAQPGRVRSDQRRSLTGRPSLRRPTGRVWATLWNRHRRRTEGSGHPALGPTIYTRSPRPGNELDLRTEGPPHNLTLSRSPRELPGRRGFCSSLRRAARGEP